MSFRVSQSERDMLQSAAAHARTTVSDFIRRKVIEAAELEIMERRVTVIPAEHWDAFEAWVRAPGEDIPALRRLAESVPSWEK